MFGPFQDLWNVSSAWRHALVAIAICYFRSSIMFCWCEIVIANSLSSFVIAKSCAYMFSIWVAYFVVINVSTSFNSCATKQAELLRIALQYQCITFFHIRNIPHFIQLTSFYRSLESLKENTHYIMICLKFMVVCLQFINGKICISKWWWSSYSHVK